MNSDSCISEQQHGLGDGQHGLKFPGSSHSAYSAACINKEQSMPVTAVLTVQQVRALTYPVPLRILHSAHHKIVMVHLGFSLTGSQWVWPEKCATLTW